MFEPPIDKEKAIPIHQQVRVHLLEMIHGGTFADGRLPGEPTLARDLGVSRMTVNKAVLGLVAEGWLVREKGRGTFVAERRDGAIATVDAIPRCVVAIPDDPAIDPEDYYFGALYWGVHRALAEHGLATEVRRLSEVVARAGERPEAIIAVNPPHEAAAALGDLAQPGVPVVLLSVGWDAPGASTIDSDNLLGAALAVNHLVDLGHRRIAFLGACGETSNTRDRVRGFEVAMKARGLAPGPVILADRPDPTDGRLDEAVLAFLSDGGTAIFAGGHQLAMRALRLTENAAAGRSFRASIVGYDDPSHLAFTQPPLTTVRQPLAEMASLAARLVQDAARHPIAAPVRHVLDPALVIRGSTAPLALEQR